MQVVVLESRRLPHREGFVLKPKEEIRARLGSKKP